MGSVKSEITMGLIFFRCFETGAYGVFGAPGVGVGIYEKWVLICGGGRQKGRREYWGDV